MPSDSQIRDGLQSLRLGSLLSWITLADECLQNPVAAMARAAGDYDRPDAISRLVTQLEKAVGRELMTRSKSNNFRSSSKKRGGHLTADGALLADVSAAIEHLLLFYQDAKNTDQAREDFCPVRKAIFSCLNIPAQRDLEKQEFSPTTGTNMIPTDRFGRRDMIMQRQHDASFGIRNRKHSALMKMLGLIGSIFRLRS